MQFKFFPALLMLYSYAAICQSESTDKPINYLFKMSPQHLTLNMLKVGVEKVNTDGTRGIQLYIQAVGNDAREDYYWSNGYDGVGFEFMLKRYLLPIKEITNRKGRSFAQGIYLGGFVQAGNYKGGFAWEDYVWDPQNQTGSNISYEYTSKTINGALGFTIGVQRIFWKVLALDAYIGAGYQLSNQRITGNAPEWAIDYYDFNEVNYRGVLPKIGLTVGLVL